MSLYNIKKKKTTLPIWAFTSISRYKRKSVSILELLLLILTIVVLFFCLDVLAAEQYGIADFAKRDAYTSSDLKACWELSPGIRADEMQGKGNFELPWQGTIGGCANCPSGFVCNCGGTTADIKKELSELYKGFVSVKMSDGDDAASIYYEYTFEANEVYQITWKYKGEVGGQEDYKVVIRNAAGTEYYNFASDIWVGASVGFTVTDISSSWTEGSLLVTTGISAKSFYRIYFETTSSDDTIYIDDLEIRRLYTTLASVPGNYILKADIGADPDFNRCSHCIYKSGSWPGSSQARGAWLDGVDDYFERTVDDDVFDPSANSGNFSLGFNFYASAISAKVRGLVCKGNGSTDFGWGCYVYSDDFYCRVANDGIYGGNFVTKADVIIEGVELSAVYTYKKVGAANSIGKIYINNETVSTNSAQEGPVWNSGQVLEIGRFIQSNSNTINGVHLRFCFWDKELTVIEANKFNNPYFPGTVYGDGFYVSTCEQTTSHAICSHHGCRDGAGNFCQAEGTSCISIFDEGTEKVPYNSFETVVGNDSNPVFTGWVKSGNITAYRSDRWHGLVSVRMKRDGSDVLLTSSCIGVSSLTEYYYFVNAKSFINNPSCVIEYVPYTSADCSTGEQSLVEVKTANAVSVWKEIGNNKTTGAGINSLKLKIRLLEDGVVNFDVVSLKTGNYRRPWIHNSGASETTYNLRDYRLHNPLSDYIDAEAKYGYEDGFCASMWVYDDFEVTDGADHLLIFVSATSGNNNQWYVSKTSDSRLYFGVWDSTGDNIYVRSAGLSSTEYSTGNYKYIEFCTDNTGNVEGHHYNANNKTWYDWTSYGGLGSGIQDGQNIEFQVGGANGGSSYNGYIAKIYIGPYQAVLPKTGFNNGRFPSKPY